MTEADKNTQRIDLLARAAGLELSKERLDLLLPAAERLNETAHWLLCHEFTFTEPAVCFLPLVRKNSSDL